MSRARFGRLRGLVPGVLALALALPGGVAAAEGDVAGVKDANAALLAGGTVVVVLLFFLLGSWWMLRRLAQELQDKAATGQDSAGRNLAARLLDLPLGAPEGSVRALLSIFIIVFGFLLLALSKPLGLTGGEALTGFIGAVISYYFAARTGEQARQVAENAADAASKAAGAADRATTAATNAGSAATSAANSATNLAQTVTAGSAALGSPGTPEQQSRLARLRDAQGKLQSLRGLIAVAGSLGVGTGAVAGADRALSRVDGLLGRIAPVVGGQADLATIGGLAEEAANVLRDLGDLGPVGHAVADAMATVGRIAGQSGPIGSLLGSLMGGSALAGPAGLVAGVVVGGLQLVKDKEKFDRWKAAMLDTPLDLGLLPATIDANLAGAALLRAPMLARLAAGGAVEPALALAVWEAVSPPGQPPEPARSAADRILAGAAGLGAEALRTAFAGNAEALADAVEDLRAAMTGAAALAGLGLPKIAVGGAEMDTSVLAGAVRTARQDSRVAAEVDRMVFMVEALGKADPAMLAQVASRLGAAEFLAGAQAQAAEKARAAEAASTPRVTTDGGSG
jgi:hypothetical protein